MSDSEETFRLREFTFYGQSKDFGTCWVYGLDIRCSAKDAPLYAEKLAYAHRTSVHYVTAGLKGISVYADPRQF